MAKSRRSYKGAPISNTVAAGGLAANATTISLATAMSGWSTASEPFFVVIDPGTSKEEKVCVKYTNSTTLTVVDPAVTSGWTASVNGRGADDTTDRNHDAGATIYPVFTAREANDANELASAYTANGDLVVHGSTSFKKIGVGTNGYALLADSTVTDGGVKWAQVGTSTLADSSVTLAKLASAVQNFLIPVGTIQAYAGATAPTGWLLCDGTSTSGYTALAALVGSTTPDLRGKFLLGKAASGTGSTLLGSGGSATIAEGNLPSHAHGVGTLATATGGSHAHTASTATAGGHDHTASSASAGSHSHTISVTDPGHNHTQNAHAHSANVTFIYSTSHVHNNEVDYLAPGQNGSTTGTINPIGSTTATNNAATTGITASSVSAGSHSHTITVDSVAAHSHTVTVDSAAGHTHTLSGSTGSIGSGTAYYQPFVAVSYIIKHD